MQNSFKDGTKKIYQDYILLRKIVNDLKEQNPITTVKSNGRFLNFSELSKKEQVKIAWSCYNSIVD